MLSRRAVRLPCTLSRPAIRSFLAPHPRARVFSTQVRHNTLENSEYQVAHITFRGDKKYAFIDGESMTALENRFRALAGNTLLKAVFLHSTFPGADLKYMSQLTNWDHASTFINRISSFCGFIHSYPIPVVAIIDGPCLGAGMELAASCDLRIAVEESATFGMPETRLGIPSVAQASLIPGLVGWGRARELLYFGEVIDAKKAYDWGFVNKVTTQAGLGQTIQEYEKRFDAADADALLCQKKVMAAWQQHDAGLLGNTQATNDNYATLMSTGRPSELMRLFIGRNR